MNRDALIELMANAYVANDRLGVDGAMAAVLAAIEAAGCRVVPERPTEEMADACGTGECGKWARGAWAQMIAASPFNGPEDAG